MATNHDAIMFVKVRKTRKDVLTVWDATDAKKSSKNHKLKPRCENRDRTKTTESRATSIRRREFHRCDEE